MAKRKRYHSNNTSTPIEADSLGLNENVSHGEAAPSTKPEAPLSTEPEAQNAPSDGYGKKSTKYWTVELEDENGVVKEGCLKLKDVWVLPSGTKVIVHWNRFSQPVGEGGGLLGAFLGAVAGNFKNFPICYERWPKVPGKYKEVVYETTIQAKFKVDDGQHKKYILQNLGKKWKDNRSKLFNDIYDFDLSREQNLNLCPEGIDLDHWAYFIDYRLREKTLAICVKNATNRQMQTVPHTLGSKTMARKQHELETSNNRIYSRAQMYPISHKKKDGAFVNDEARDKSVQLAMLESEGASSQDTHDDVFVKLFGKEHPGRVRGMGFGVCPSQVFKSTSSHCGGTSSSCSHGSETAKIQQMEAELKENKAAVSMLQAQVNYFVKHYMGGVVPSNFPTIGGNGIADMESLVRARPSSSASHEPQDNGLSNT